MVKTPEFLILSRVDGHWASCHTGKAQNQQGNKQNHSRALHEFYLLLGIFLTGDLVSQNGTQKCLGSFALGLGEEGVRRALFDHTAFIHEDDPVRNPPGKTHLMGDHDHGHAFPGQIGHNLKDLVDHFRVQR